MPTYTIRLRRGLAADWTAVNPVLAEGETGVESDTRYFKVGTGTLAWNALPYVVGPGDLMPDADGIPDGKMLVTENETWIITDAPETGVASQTTTTQFTTTAGQADFTLPSEPVPGTLRVYRNGLLQAVGHWSKTGLTVTLADVCAAGEIIQLVQDGATGTVISDMPSAVGVADGKMLITLDDDWVIADIPEGLPIGMMVYKGVYTPGTGGIKGEVYDYLGVTYLCIADTANDPLAGTISTPTINTMTRAGSAAVNGANVDLTNSTSQQGMVHDSVIFNDPNQLILTATIDTLAGADGFSIGVTDSDQVATTVSTPDGSVGGWVSHLSWSNNRVDTRFCTSTGGGNNAVTRQFSTSPSGLHTWEVKFVRTTGRNYLVSYKRDGVDQWVDQGPITLPVHMRGFVNAFTGGTGGVHQLKALTVSASQLQTGWRKGITL